MESNEANLIINGETYIVTPINEEDLHVKIIKPRTVDIEWLPFIQSLNNSLN